MSRIDVEGFMSFLAGQKLSGMSRARKLAAVRKFFTFLEVNKVLATNPALTVIGARREEKEPLLSRLNGWPMRSPADASLSPSRVPTHGSGPMWLATP